MKYDPEYNSYRFSPDELNVIVQSLKFYSKNSPVEQEKVAVVIIKNLIEQLKILCV